MDPFNCRGLIIRSSEYKEKDRLLSVLTADRGLITICAKGVAKPGSSLGCFSMPYMLCDFVVTISHGYYYLSLEQMTVAAHISSCLMDCTLQSENSKEAYELAVYAYYMLANNKGKYLLIYSAFNWRLLTIAGFTVTYDLEDTIGRSKFMINITGGDGTDGNNRAFNRMLDEPSVRALNYFATCDLKKLFTATADKKTEQELKDFTTDYLSIHFEKTYDSLSVLNNL